jgi:transposase
VLAGTATAAPKRRDGIVEAIRVLRTARRGASKARTAAINQLKALLVTAPAPVREALDDLSTSASVTTCARFRPDEAGLADPAHASKAALQAIARRIQLLEAELELADQRLATLVGRAALRLLQLLPIGTDHAGQLLITAGSTPSGRIHLLPAAPCPGWPGRPCRAPPCPVRQPALPPLGPGAVEPVDSGPLGRRSRPRLPGPTRLGSAAGQAP